MTIFFRIRTTDTSSRKQSTASSRTAQSQHFYWDDIASPRIGKHGVQAAQLAALKQVRPECCTPASRQSKSPRRSLARAVNSFRWWQYAGVLPDGSSGIRKTRKNGNVRHLRKGRRNGSWPHERLDPPRVPVVHVVAACRGSIRQTEELRHGIVGHRLAAGEAGPSACLLRRICGVRQGRRRTLAQEYG